MTSETCLQCKKEIPVNACQQGQLIDGEWFPLHVGCADMWCAEEIDVYTIVSEDYGYTGDLGCATSELENMEDEQEITFTKRKMKRVEYMNLPEANF